MKNLLALTLLFSGPVFAQADMCNINPGKVVKRIPLPRTPNYFFKMSPDGTQLYYISEMKNYQLNTLTGNETRLPGQADPVPSGDGKLLTFISRQSGTNAWIIEAAPLSTPFALPKDADKVLLRLAGGSYQSVGTPDNQGAYPFFFLDEINGKLIYQKLKKKSSNQFELSPEVELANNADQFRLPMLSPDGKRFSALNMKINKTQIYELVGNPPKPKLIATLPVAGGKASFSYDNQKVTFHLTRTQGHESHDSLYPSVLGRDNSLRNVYTYDLKTKKISQVTDNTTSDSYFPIFLKNGDVAYIDRSNDGKFTLNISKNSSQQNAREFSAVADCYGEGVEDQLNRLGDLWAKACGKWAEKKDIDTGISLTAALNMPAATCEKLAMEAKDPDLVKLCEALKGKKMANVPATPIPTTPPPADDAGKKIFQNRCALCHEGEQQKVMSSPTLKDRISGNSTGTMPPSGPILTTGEQQFLLDYLKKF